MAQRPHSSINMVYVGEPISNRRAGLVAGDGATASGSKAGAMKVGDPHLWCGVHSPHVIPVYGAACIRRT